MIYVQQRNLPRVQLAVLCRRSCCAAAAAAGVTCTTTGNAPYPSLVCISTHTSFHPLSPLSHLSGTPCRPVAAPSRPRSSH